MCLCFTARRKLNLKYPSVPDCRLLVARKNKSIFEAVRRSYDDQTEQARGSVPMDGDVTSACKHSVHSKEPAGINEEWDG